MRMPCRRGQAQGVNPVLDRASYTPWSIVLGRSAVLCVEICALCLLENKPMHTHPSYNPFTVGEGEKRGVRGGVDEEAVIEMPLMVMDFED